MTITATDWGPKVGQRSPWGNIQDSTEIADGIHNVGTPGHGGVKLDRQRNAKVPAYMRQRGGWYEEDSDWCIPAIVFEKEWREWADGTKQTTGDQQIDHAKATFINWHPEAYAKWNDVPLESLAGKSRRYDEKVWNEVHANDLIVISAVGDWHKDCSKGNVLVTATVGGKRAQGFPGARQFFVPADEYAAREGFGFVVDPSRHNEVVKVADGTS
jgi:hypothetical protein